MNTKTILTIRKLFEWFSEAFLWLVITTMMFVFIWTLYKATNAWGLGDLTPKEIFLRGITMGMTICVIVLVFYRKVLLPVLQERGTERVGEI